MESKETNSVLSLFSSDNQPIIHQRRIKSASLLLDKISSEYFPDKNELKGENIIDMPNIECKENPDVPIVKVIEKGNLLLNSNSYGFKGRSPYVSNANTRPKGTNSNTNNTNNSKMNSNQKIINGFIFTELKDKVFEYRCSVCNFVAHANGELHKHLTMHNHFILPKKNKKNKSKNYHKQENRLNQTFMFSMNKPKKYLEKK